MAVILNKLYIKASKLSVTVVFTEQELFTDHIFFVFTQVLDKPLLLTYPAAQGMLLQTASLTNIQR